MSALVRATVGVSLAALALGDRLIAVEVNPLAVGPDGAEALDALVVVRS
jgi:hypothetical protein